MALTNIVTDAAGDSGASASQAVTGGMVFVGLTDSADLTSVSITVEFSDDDSAFYQLTSNGSPSNDISLFNGVLPAGYLRVNITGGGAGDNIDIDMKETALATSAALATVDTNVDAILVDTSTTLDGKINTIDTNVDSILVDTNNSDNLMKIIANQVTSILTKINNTLPFGN